MPQAPVPELSPPPQADESYSRTSGFDVHLANFDGPFDLLLSLIAKRRLDITEVALAAVTDEFIAYLSARQDWDLDKASEFLLVAATLLDLKAARLLPSGEVEDPEDIALLEARDLLFARLLQYRAYQQVAAQLQDRLDTVGRRRPRAVGLDPHLRGLLPDLVNTVTPEQFALLAVSAMRPKAVPTVSLEHLHAPAVSVAEQAERIVQLLRRAGACSFRQLVADAAHPGVVVARFLALLELFRQAAVSFEQVEALGDLTVRWTGQDHELPAGSEFDDGPQQSPGEPTHDQP